MSCDTINIPHLIYRFSSWESNPLINEILTTSVNVEQVFFNQKSKKKKHLSFVLENLLILY